MKTKIAINGFGRIGRIFFRCAFECPDIEIVAVNDLVAPEVMAYLLGYDTVYGHYEKSVEIENGELIVDGKTGFVVAPEKGIEGLKEALSKIDTIKPQDCRDHVVKNFSTQTMVDSYEKTYSEIINLKKS